MITISSHIQGLILVSQKHVLLTESKGKLCAYFWLSQYFAHVTGIALKKLTWIIITRFYFCRTGADADDVQTELSSADSERVAMVQQQNLKE